MRHKWIGIVGLLGAMLVARAGEKIELRAYQAQFPTNNESQHFGIGDDGVTIHYFSNGSVEWTVPVAMAGKYHLGVAASCSDADGEFAEFKVTVNGKDAGKPVKLKSKKRDDYGVDLDLPAGKVKVAIAFTNDKYESRKYDRNLFVHQVVLTQR